MQDSFTLSYNAKGRHDLKAGAEFLLHHEMSANCTNCMGNIDARNGAISTLRPRIEDIFPDAFNVDTWNLAAISPLVRTYRLGVHKGRRDDVDLPYYAAYVQDDWKMTNKLTLNLGVRYDLTIDSFAQYGEFEPFMVKGRPQDANNVQPRVGFAYQLNDRTVMRGGAGKYYAEVITPVVLYALEPATIAVLEVANDGRPDFAVNPFNGPAPSFAEARDAVLLGAAAGGELRGLARAQLHRRGAVRAARRGRDGAAGRVRARAADVAGRRSARSGRSAAHDVGRSRLRLQPRPRREVHPGQRQPELHERERHRHQQPVHQSRRCCRIRSSASSR